MRNGATCCQPRDLHPCHARDTSEGQRGAEVSHPGSAIPGVTLPSHGVTPCALSPFSGTVQAQQQPPPTPTARHRRRPMTNRDFVRPVVANPAANQAWALGVVRALDGAALDSLQPCVTITAALDHHLPAPFSIRPPLPACPPLESPAQDHPALQGHTLPLPLPPACSPRPSAPIPSPSPSLRTQPAISDTSLLYLRSRPASDHPE